MNTLNDAFAGQHEPHNSVAVTCKTIGSPPRSSMMSGVAFRGEPLKLYNRGAGVLMSPCTDDKAPARALPSVFCTSNIQPACVLTWGGTCLFGVHVGTCKRHKI